VNENDGSNGKHERERKIACRIAIRKPEGKKPLEDLGVGGG
jgi:hypothetical protein